MAEENANVLDFTDTPKDSAVNFSFNFDDLPDNEPLKEGTYNVEVIKAEATKSKAGAAMVKLQLKVLNLEPKTILFDVLSFKNQGSLRIVKAKLIGLGYQQTKGDVDLSTLCDDLVGLVAGAKVGIVDAVVDESTGEVKYPAKNNIKSYTQVIASVADLL